MDDIDGLELVLETSWPPTPAHRHEGDFTQSYDEQVLR